MKIEKYSFTQTETHSEEVSTTLTELQKEMPYLSKKTIKDWVLSGDREYKIIKGGKIKLYKKE
nr:hypothetical protein [uncultured Flavobacterium sp.]